MKTKSLFIIAGLVLVYITGFTQSNKEIQKQFEKSLRNSLINAAANVLLGNDPNVNINDIKSSLPGGGISGIIMFSDGSLKDFVGVKYICGHNVNQPSFIDGRPVIWINDQDSWRSIELYDVSTISYNNLEYVNSGNFNLSMVVSLKDGSSFEYIASPVRDFVTMVINNGQSVNDQQFLVFNSEQLFIKSIMFY